MKKMLITGVNGFIGRSAKEYFEKAYDIVGIDIAEKYMGREDTGSLTYYQCNMSKDPAELSMLMSNVQPDVILHCAGSANVGASVLNPMADLDGNLHSLYQLLISLKAIEKKPKDHFHVKCSRLWQSGQPADQRDRHTGADIAVWPSQAHV